MKKLLQNKKLLAVIGGAAALVLIIAVYVAIQSKPPVTDPVSESSASAPDTSVTIEFPENSETPEIPGDRATSEIPDDGSGLKPNESVSTGSGKTNTDEKAQDIAPPAKEAGAPKNTDSDPNGGGIQIGNGDNPAPYNCGYKNHHCQDADSHAWILNMELEGCEYCGSHSCPSFYAVNEWGFTRYTPSKCPQYDVKKDALEYCQACGRKNGNGDNNTCQKWIVDFTCPICGELVKANKCHTH